jgi:prepilin-type processing-associated H-X9-DG protein
MLTTNTPAGWTHAMHQQQGNVALADGHVEQLTTSKLREALKYSGSATNRLALP